MSFTFIHSLLYRVLGSLDSAHSDRPTPGQAQGRHLSAHSSAILRNQPIIDQVLQLFHLLHGRDDIGNATNFAGHMFSLMTSSHLLQSKKPDFTTAPLLAPFSDEDVGQFANGATAAREFARIRKARTLLRNEVSRIPTHPQPHLRQEPPPSPQIHQFAAFQPTAKPRPASTYVTSH